MKIKNITLYSLALLLVIGFNSCSSDNDSNEEQEIVITVNTNDFTATINENPVNGQVVGAVEGTTNQGSVVFIISEQTPEGSFEIDAITGEITVSDVSMFNFEVNSIITGIVKVLNGDVSKDALVTITLNDVEEENIYYGDIELKSQFDVNEFGANNFTNISGSLHINSYFGNEETIITDLSPLNSIKTVGNHFTVFGYDILNFDGINIESVGGNIFINYCTSLTNIDGLSSITSVLGGLELSSNPLIVNVDGLNNINSLGGDLIFSSNDNLSNIEGLNNLQHVGGKLGFYGVDDLSNLEELNNLQYVGGDMTFYGNDFLFNFCGISSLLINNGLIGEYRAENNAYNPSQQDIIDGNCSL